MPFDKAPRTPEGIFRSIEGAGKILKTTAFYKKPISKKIENISKTIVKTIISIKFAIKTLYFHTCKNVPIFLKN